MSTSFAVVTPVLLLMVFGVIQAGIWWHGRHAAEQAADTATDIARSYRSATSQARDAGTHVARQAGLTQVVVSIHRTHQQVTVTVTGRTPMPLDLGWGSIAETATAPMERIT